MDTVYSLEVWVPDGEQWRWSAIGAYPTLDMAVPAGTVLEFSILVMNPKDAETVREWLDYGALRGLFQWRNSGKGRFEWEEVARD